VQTSEVEINILISVIVSRILRMRVRKWDVACYLKLSFWIHTKVYFRISLVKLGTIRVKVFTKILSQCNTVVKVSGTTE